MITYKHAYGGTAFDVEVPIKRFAQLFGRTPEWANSVEVGSKVGDRSLNVNGRWMEYLGYVRMVRKFPGAPPARRYMLTAIDHGRALRELAHD